MEAVPLQGKQRNPYSSHLRERIVDLYLNDEYTMRHISQMFHGRPCVKTVSRIINSFLRDGRSSLKLRGQSGRLRPARKMDLLTKQMLVDVVDRLETSRLQDIAAALCIDADVHHGHYSALDVCRALHEMGMVRVRVTNRAYEADPEQQRQWVEYCCQSGIGLQDWVFLDEVYVDNRTTNAKYAWVPRGYKSKVSSIFVRGRRYTTIAAMSCKGIIAAWTFEGAADADAFKTFIIDHLTSKMGQWPSDHSVLVMDNCRIHSKDWLKDWAEFIGCEVKYIPPYSPQFNPIEKVFGIVKQYLRTHARDLNEIPATEAIGLALDDASQGDKCRNFIMNTPGRPYSFEL